MGAGWGRFDPVRGQANAQAPRLGSTAARLKLKGIDGGPHKQRSVWFNSTRRGGPYQGLTCSCRGGKPPGLRGCCTDAAWLSSARAVRCWVKSRNERNPCCQLYFSGETARSKREEGGDDVKSACPLRPGLHTRYNGRYSGSRHGDVKLIPENRPQFRLQAETRLHEGGVASNRGSAHRGEYVPGPCTHRPSRHGSWQRLKWVAEPQGQNPLGRG